MKIPPDRKAADKVIDQDGEFDASLDDDEPTTDELAEMLRESLQQAMEGKTRPASEVMRELREILAADDDASRNR